MSSDTLNTSVARLYGQVALVTGGGRGIGRAVVERLTSEGAAVIATQRSAEEGQALVDELTGRGASVTFVQGDVRNHDSVEHVVQSGVERFGRLDIVVNNAAIGLLRTAADTSDPEYDSVFDTNLRSIFHTSRFAIPHLMAAGGGAIVNIGSVAAYVGFEADAAYCASKGAVLALTKQMAMDYAPHGIRVNCVSPGFVETDQMRAYVAGHEDPRAVEREVAALHPLGRIGHAHEIAAAVAFLVSEDASFITGAALSVDGGLLARP